MRSKIYEYVDAIYSMGISSVKPSVYSQVYALGKTAVERFGNDPTTFKETLKKYNAENYRKTIKKKAVTLPSDLLGFNSWDIMEYTDCLIAILQVDLECPGFIQNFPEALSFLKQINGNAIAIGQISNNFEELYDKTIKLFNRYSGKSDFKYVKSLFEIPDEKSGRRYDEKEPRFDDYISLEFLKFWKSGNEEQKYYLKKNYIHLETLLPEDYYAIIRQLKIVEDDVDMEVTDLRWVDLYFEKLDEIIKEVHSGISSISPTTMKKINLTLT